jgi:hypothetical protein
VYIQPSFKASACSFDGLLRRCPLKPAIAGIASTHLSNILESCRLSPLTKITNRKPVASTTIRRLEPSLPLRRVEPHFLPSRGVASRGHQCWPGSNGSGHVHACEAVRPGATAPRRQQYSSRAGAASKSCRHRTQGIEEGLPTECLFAERTGCR